MSIGVPRAAKDNPSATLLIVQLVGVLLYPFMEGTSQGRAAFSVLGIVVLALAVLTVADLRRSHG